MAHVKAAAILLALCPLTAFCADSLVYEGTYSRGGSKGIYAYRIQSATGKLRPLGVVIEMSDPSFLVVHPNHRFLYAVSEDANTVNAFAIEGKTGKLEFLNRVPSRGKGPCHLALDATGRWLAVANYESGSMALMPVESSGRLGEATVVKQHQGAGLMLTKSCLRRTIASFWWPTWGSTGFSYIDSMPPRERCRRMNRRSLRWRPVPA
jgi:6-phosphogluconolactonase